MKVGVYNLYWSTFGGGEQQAGGIADALSADHKVELLGPEEIDLQVLRDRLGLRLEGVTFRCISADDLSATLASADYDLFVNHTYRSMAPNLARHGIYFVMFPHRFRASAVHRRARKIAGAAAAPARVLAGVHPLTDAGGAVVEGPVLVHVDERVRSLRVEFDAAEPEEIAVAVVRHSATVRTHLLSGPTTVELDLSAEPAGVHGRDVLFGAAPRKESSLRLTGISVDGETVPFAPRSLRQRLVDVHPDAFLESYDTVVALSEYTLGWTRKWWGRGEAVLSPPVRMRAPGDKEQLIVAVGRFFDQKSGHSKQQLELVRAFRSLVEHGLVGWRFMLVGGCNSADREYSMAVRREARGLPVEVHLNAPGTFLDEQIAKATFLWHAAGLGADLDAHPDRAEHFGIAPIEAMSAGVVPLVFAAAGPTEVVQHGVSGLHFHSADELVAQTLELIANPSRRSELATAAVERANEYDGSHFEQRVRELVAKTAG